MRTFRYEAATPEGFVERGAVSARDRAAAVRILGARNLIPIKVKQAAEREGTVRYSKGELAIFFRGVATLLSAGVPIGSAIGMTDDGSRPRQLGADLQHRMRDGASLSDAIAAHRCVPGIVASIISAGERSDLTAALQDAANHLEGEALLAAQLRSALVYPSMLILVGSAAIAVISLGVLPRFVTLLDGAGTQLPPATALLLAATSFTQRFWPIVMVVLSVTAAAGVRFASTARGRRWLLSAPFLGRLTLNLVTARSARVLGTMLSHGSPTLIAMSAARTAADNREIVHRFERASERVRSGSGMGAALAAESALAGQALELLRIGERSGRVPEMLMHASKLAEDSATRTLKTVLQIIEPALILVLGGVVAFVALAMLQAVYGLRIGG